jgi:hypothetical protein
LRQPISAHPAPRFGLPHPQDRAIEENVLICASPPALHPLGQPSVARPTGFPALRFPTGQLRKEPRADLQQRSNAPVDSLTPVRLTLRAAFSSLPRSFPICLGDLDLPRTLSGNPGKNLEQSRLPSPIMPNQPQTFPAAKFKGNSLHSPEFARPKAGRGVERRATRVKGFFPRRAGVARCASKRCVFRIRCKLACGRI